MGDLLKKAIILGTMLITIAIIAGEIATGDIKNWQGFEILALVLQCVAFVIFFLDGTVLWR